MIELSRRFVLLLAVTILMTIPLIKGHGPSLNDGHVAFLPYSAESAVIKIDGDLLPRGIYAVREGDDLATVIKMTFPAQPFVMSDTTALDTRLHRGDVVELSHGPVQQAVFKLKSMKAREKMLLGIPLDPDRMDYDDWRSLPGIGPVLAERIIDSRQKYGDYGSLEAVKRVQGIGDITYDKLRKHF